MGPWNRLWGGRAWGWESSRACLPDRLPTICRCPSDRRMGVTRTEHRPVGLGARIGGVDGTLAPHARNPQLAQLPLANRKHPPRLPASPSGISVQCPSHLRINWTLGTTPGTAQHPAAQAPTGPHWGGKGQSGIGHVLTGARVPQAPQPLDGRGGLGPAGTEGRSHTGGGIRGQGGTRLRCRCRPQPRSDQRTPLGARWGLPWGRRWGR